MWIGRQWHSLRNRYGRQPLLVRLVFVFAIISLPILGCSVVAWGRLQYTHWFVYTDEDRDFIRTQRAIYPDGVPSTARSLKAEMEPISDPDVALERHPNWAVLRLRNGQWVFGYGINSHALFKPGRGTVVLKDSSGRVRIFFGHVCGENGWLAYRNWEDSSLDAFYARLTEYFLREWVPGQ